MAENNNTLLETYLSLIRHWASPFLVPKNPSQAGALKMFFCGSIDELRSEYNT